MAETPLDRLPQGWDQTAEDYDTVVKYNFTPQFAKDALCLALGGNAEDDLSEIIQKKDKPISILDVATGTGALSVMAANVLKEGNKGQVLATDFSPKMVEIVQKKGTDAQLQNLDCKIMDGQALKIEDESHDFAFCIFGLMFFPDPVQGLKEMHRVLKKGGRVAVATWSNGHNDIKEIMMAAMKLLAPAKQSQAPPDPAQAPSKPPGLPFTTPESLEEAFAQAGFSSTKVHTFSHKLELPSFELFLQMQSSNPALKALFPADKKAVLDNAVMQVLKEMYTLPLSLSSEALIAIATK